MFTPRDYLLIACALAVFGGILFNTLFIVVLVFRGARSKPLTMPIRHEPDPASTLRETADI
jgi:hypothetical protein